ncbi:hypothetical protein HS088_TW22G00704 [Tripterygium wilfordii]|uniref:Uncharacterized protein n=1 Tax=Tripterygium wilfordii TaxID=458696 RepID=A0A7J7BYV6_TRIWF|nr:hypothetical protein HS088_TW22G00704 [Tripterygium wilfordii]
MGGRTSVIIGSQRGRIQEIKRGNIKKANAINLFLVLSSLFLASVDAESNNNGILDEIELTPTCVGVYGVKSGDSCYAVAAMHVEGAEFS